MKNFLSVVGVVALIITAVGAIALITVNANVGATPTPRPYSGRCVETKVINGVTTFVNTPCKGEEKARASEWTNTLSPKCAKEITEYRASPACEAEGNRWHAELKQKLNDPAFRDQLLNNPDFRTR
jgi:hypothetical protein